MFNQARLKLTAWYLLIIMIISLAFSFFIYQLLTAEIDRFARNQQFRLDRQFQDQMMVPPPVYVNSDLVAEIKNRLKISLIIIDGTILLISGISGYFLAGRTLKPIREMVNEQNRFISDASHEFRTPLTSLKSSMEVFLRETKPTISEAKKLINENIDDVNKLQNLSDGLLNLAHFQEKIRQIKLTQIPIDQPITEAIQKVLPIAQTKKNQIIYQPSHLQVFAEHQSLVNLFVIFLDNAIKYSQENQKIIISTVPISGSVSISIKDQGIGIDNKDLPKIFDRFYRSDSARRHNGLGGYGLGLSIAKNIINLHHGSIDVKSTVGKGTTFTIKLPIVKIS